MFAETRGRYATGQLLFYVCMAVCIAILPRGLAVNAGISYYGNFASTIVPYAIGLCGSAVSVWLASADRALEVPGGLRLLLKVLAVLIVGVVLTPYTFDETISNLHTLLGISVFVIQLLLTLWIVQQLRWRSWAVLLWVAQLGAGVVCALYIRPAQGLLIQFELLFQLIFSVLVYFYVSARVAARGALERVGG